MFKLWAKTIKNNKLVRDMVVENDSAALSRTQKIYAALETVCLSFDLSVPMWLESNITEFKRTSKTRFSGDNFFDPVEFDYLEICVLEED